MEVFELILIVELVESFSKIEAVKGLLGSSYLWGECMLWCPNNCVIGVTSTEISTWYATRKLI